MIPKYNAQLRADNKAIILEFQVWSLPVNELWWAKLIIPSKFIKKQVPITQADFDDFADLDNFN